MACGCDERRKALITTGKAIAQGDGQAVANQLKFIATSTIEDAGKVARDRIAQARAKLSMRRR